MKNDVFGRELAVGDTIICFIYKGKHIHIETISGFWKSGYMVSNGFHKLKSECLILKRADGTTYFNNDGLPFNGWITNNEDKYIL